MGNLNELAQKIYQANVDKGFYEDIDQTILFLQQNNAPKEVIQTVEKAIVGQRLMLITSEIAEALEGNRKDKKADIFQFLNEKRGSLHSDKEGFNKSFEKHIKDTPEDEIADGLIRILDYCGKYGIDIDFHVRTKLEYNALRPHKHGKTY